MPAIFNTQKQQAIFNNKISDYLSKKQILL